MKKYAFVLLSFCCILMGTSSCGEASKAPKNKPLPNTQKVYLQGSDVSMQLPNNFKRSSRYRLEEDVPFLSQDSLLLYNTQESLEQMELADEDMEVYVDTTKLFHLLTFNNNPEYLSLNKEIGTIIGSQLYTSFKELEQRGLPIRVEKEKSTFKVNQKNSYFKFKYKIINELTNFRYYQTIFFVSTKNHTLFIGEQSTDEYDLDSYINTLAE